MNNFANQPSKLYLVNDRFNGMTKRSAALLFMTFCIGVMSTVSIQCSSTKRHGSAAATSPDVSQVSLPLDSASENQSAANGIRNNYFLSSDAKPAPSDSIKSKSTSPRVLHISGGSFSIYDTKLDTAAHNSDKSQRMIKLDSTRYNYDMDVGILTNEEATNLSLKLETSELVTLSLVDSTLFENFEKDDFEKKVTQYGAKYLLVTVSETDSEQRRAFMRQSTNSA